MANQYLFGFVASREVEPLPPGGATGPAHVVWADGLGCVAASYAGEALRYLAKPDVVRLLLHHQRVTEHAMRYGPVLPVRFGTVLPSRRQVRTLLRQAAEFLRAALGSVAGKLEIEVAATWDAGRVLQDIAKDKEIAEERDALLGRGAPTLGERARFGQLVKRRMDERREAYQRRLMEALRPVVLDFIANPLLSDEMVMNVACLLETARQAEFDERLRELDEACEREILFRVIGPLPPYSFSSLDVTCLDASAVAEAQNELGVDQDATATDVRRAYRHLAAAQAQTAAGDPRAAQDLHRLRRAADLLQQLKSPLSPSRAVADGGDALALGAQRCGPFLLALRRTSLDDVDVAHFGTAREVNG
ncbi:MAG: GvpL/GvpF family gas vesicle protein [Chloroflexi bacterium]|nr:GvpL/GvpF family gas vesicle protein [Chloroflexota bacterium]